MNLHGKRIVITRAKHQADALAIILREHGAIPIFYPCIAIIPPTDITPLDDALSRLSAYDWLLITSANTVEVLHQRLSERAIIADWEALYIGAVGEATAQAFRLTFNKQSIFTPTRQTAQQLGWELPILNNEKILLPQSALAKPTLADILTQRGAEVRVITAYQTIPDIGGDDIHPLLARGMIDAVTFASSSAVKHFVMRVGYVPDVPVVCMGENIAQTAHEAGFARVAVADDACLDAIARALGKI